MKILPVVFALLIFSNLATAQSSQTEICAQLQAKADDACAHSICDSLITNGTYRSLSQCTSDGDYQEYAQVACDQNPSANLNCAQ